MKKVRTIDCHYFTKQHELLLELVVGFNEPGPADKKRALIHEYLEEIEVLLNCSDFSPASKECRECRRVMQERKRSAEASLKGPELSTSGV